jgi:hypothetical protein
LAPWFLSVKENWELDNIEVHSFCCSICTAEHRFRFEMEYTFTFESCVFESCVFESRVLESRVLEAHVWGNLNRNSSFDS